MDEQLKDIGNQVKEGHVEPQKISEDMLVIVKENKFMFASEIDYAVSILGGIAEQSYSDNKALANIFEATNTVSKKQIGGVKNLTQTQACLDIVDLIGENVNVERSSTFKLAGDGLALTAVDIEQK